MIIIIKWPYFFDSGTREPSLLSKSHPQSLNKLDPLAANRKNKATF